MINATSTYRAAMVAWLRRMVFSGPQRIRYGWRIVIPLERRMLFEIAVLQHLALRIWCAIPSQWLKRWRAGK